jgi:hypothetical protein
MSKIWRENHFLEQILEARRERTNHGKSAALFLSSNPSSGQTKFSVTDWFEEKRTDVLDIPIHFRVLTSKRSR